MADVIHLLPDSIASQIAAGEVIQRPASVVKELLENSVDAGADNIKLIVKDAGKTLIQVVDNGIGMSETDARMCFERHATSKIKSANDIFRINTKGFRGEALASIAAIAHVELITRQREVETGTKVVIMGSKVIRQEIVQSEPGTNIAVKNLFFNVPARRKFLKSDIVEFKHITDEFIRIALAHTEISFSLYNNGKEIYRLPASNLKQRIVNIFGRGFDNKLLSISEKTSFLEISGFIGKIEAARKSRNNQFIFVNNRFIKSNYLSHAIKTAYSGYIDEEKNPVYFLFLKTDPSNIDVNIHPTKQEVKFEDEKLIYNYIRAAVKKVVSNFSGLPALDFEEKDDLNTLIRGKNRSKTGGLNRQQYGGGEKKSAEDWESAYEILKKGSSRGETLPDENLPSRLNELEETFDNKPGDDNALFQLDKAYIVRPVEEGLMIIDQYYAHQRILYEKYMKSMEKGNVKIRQLLFPVEIQIEKNNIPVFEEMIKKINGYGFVIEKKEENKFFVKGIPIEMEEGASVSILLDKIMTDMIENKYMDFGIKENFAKILSRSNAKKHGHILTKKEMDFLVEALFQCKNPYKSPGGKNTYIIVETNDIKKRF